MLPHDRQPLFQLPMQLPDQACAHGCAPISDGVAARYTSLDPTTTILDTFTSSLGRKLRNRQAWRNWRSPSPLDQGGAPALTSLGFKPPLLEHFALGGGKATELELGNMIQNIHVQERAYKDKLSKRKGVKQKIPEGA